VRAGSKDMQSESNDIITIQFVNSRLRWNSGVRFSLMI